MRAQLVTTPLGLATVVALTSVASAETSKVPPKVDPDPPQVQEITADDPTASASADPTKPSQSTPDTPSAETPVRTMDELTVPRSNLRFGINFFGDSSLVISPNSPRTSFALGALGIRLLGELGPSLDAIAEFALETVPSVGPISDVEQLAIRWRYGPGTLEVGRFHTEIGYWNTAYHHGLWLQTPIERPHGVRFEDDGGIVPVHWLGAHYSLRAAAGPGKVTLTLGIGNGRGATVDDLNVLGDNNDAKSALLKVKYKTSLVEVGLGVIYDVIGTANMMVRPALPGEKLYELLGNGYLALRGDGAIAIAEGFAVRHMAGDQSWMTYSLFGVVGYAVTPWLTPYAAIDAIHGANDDPFFTPNPALATPIDLTQVLTGLRFETSTWSALKVEFRLTAVSGTPTDYSGVANWSFGL